METIISQLNSLFAGNVPYYIIIFGSAISVFAIFDINIREIQIKTVDIWGKGRTVALCFGIAVFILGVFVKFILPLSIASPPQGTRAGSPAAVVTSTKTPLSIASNSSLIPQGKAPTITDPLKDNSEGYNWMTPSGSTGMCSFANDEYVVSAPGGIDNGIGCYATAASFGNFVYQIKMTILKGMDDTNNSAVGPTFRVNATTGQNYEVSFDVKGDWQVASDIKPLTNNGSLCYNPCPAFHAGYGQANYITIYASGSSIKIQINGQNLGSYIDTNYTNGSIGVDMAPGKNASEVAFSAVRVWKL